MSRPEDRFTNTPEDAARFERMHGEEGFSRADLDYSPDPPDEPDEELERYIEMEAEDPIVHPPWCTLPPDHTPWAWMKVGFDWYAQVCEPEPADA